MNGEEIDAKVINEKINKCIQNLDCENFIDNFPNILDSLIYILLEEGKDEDKLVGGELLRNCVVFTENKNNFQIEFVKQFMKHVYGIEISAKEDSNTPMFGGVAAYDKKSNTIFYSTMGFLLGDSEMSGVLIALLHEVRHKVQNDAMSADKVEEILKYSPCMILLAKEFAYEEVHGENGRKFYKDNYNKIYYETDAIFQSLIEVRTMLHILIKKYLNNREVDDSLKLELNKKVERLNDIIANDVSIIMARHKGFGRLDNGIWGELYTNDPINSSYMINGQEEDRLILLDKFIKSHPELQENFPILKMIFNGNVPKTYQEITSDRAGLLRKYNSNKQMMNQVDKFYDMIIKSDPILYLEHIKEDKKAINDFLRAHPSLIDEYPQIKSMLKLPDDIEI